MTLQKLIVLTVAGIFFGFACVAEESRAGITAGATTPLQPGGFRVQLSGAVEGSFEGTAQAFKMPGGDWGIQFVSPRTTPATESILIVIPKSAAPGEHKVQGYEKVFAQDSTVTAVGATYTSAAFMGLRAEGTLKLESLAPLFSGAFEFTVSTMGSDKQVTARGTFHKLSLSK